MPGSQTSSSTASKGRSSNIRSPSSPLSALTTSTPSFNVATTATVTVTISNIATTDTTVLISSADPTIVAAPVSVTIPANARTANFTVAGLVAGTTQLTAT